MFRSPYLVIALISIFCLLVIVSAVRAVTARSWTARFNNALTALAGGVMASLAAGWGSGDIIPALPLLAVVGASFLLQAACHGGRVFPTADRGRAAALYSALMMGIAAWVVISAARASGSVQEHPAHELGVILTDLTGAIVLVLAGAGWLLATFATPAGTGAIPVPKTRGLQEVLLAVGLAVALYAVS
ncbi:hypothetical protein E5206_10930 [Arthrobacter sp. PAMC25564]|uniref:hypothetical protein n=1 Tax=Arthrobacter sp. PAMC25564 TaxID=2565366 RepID=UPI0010A20C97|nr:hypothetical protein [Arthrobacter sp. PAMC25564]QCB97371.1 hypothetical protein E5206_10930 [Arthrobacter sp. PAMC25564]